MHASSLLTFMYELQSLNIEHKETVNDITDQIAELRKNICFITSDSGQ